MARSISQKIVIVTRPTRMRVLEQEYGTRGQAKFLMESARLNDNERRVAGGGMASALPVDADFRDLAGEDDQYLRVIEQLQIDFKHFGLPVQVVDRRFLPNFIFGPKDIVVTVGQDGLVANTAKYALKQVIVAVNPDPKRFDGVLLPFQPPDATEAVAKVLGEKAKIRHVTLAEAILPDGQRMLAFNDLFAGTQSHISARYRIEVDGQAEAQSSSGVLVSTGAGSTGWLSSVFNMTQGMLRFSADQPRPTDLVKSLRLQWEDPRLLFVVREPFVSQTSSANIVAGFLDEGHELILESLMSEQGVIFSDGIEADFMRFNSGTIARMRKSSERAHLAVK